MFRIFFKWVLKGTFFQLKSLAGDEISIVNMKYKNTLVATYKVGIANYLQCCH